MEPANIVVMVMTIFVMTSHVKAGKNAYSNDINKCLFDSWPPGVLATKVMCPDSQLCYSVKDKNPAQYAVCYNRKTLIPDFTGHIVPKDTQGNGRCVWHDEKGPFAPKPQSSTDDYKTTLQNGLFPNFDGKNQICSRGHLTPNADFKTKDERELTMINTNIAPQWQPFNGGNWAGVESAVRKYAEMVQRELYVFTGTAGYGNILNGKEVKVKLNGKVYAPRFYWKVVCDPEAPPPKGSRTKGQSVVLMADNNIGDISTIKIESFWDKSKLQTKKLGFIQLYSLDQAEKTFIVSNFHLPPLGDKCNPKYQGDFLNALLVKSLS